VEDLDFDLLAANAHHDQWSDVIRMAVAHGRPAERARLLRKIIDRGDREPGHGTRLHLLAMACLEHATELDPQVRAAVEERAEQLIPPQTLEDAGSLAEAGPLVLELLPDPEGLSDDEVFSVIIAASMIGGDAAVPLLARYAERRPEIARPELAAFPRTIDPALYATEVLSRIIDPAQTFIATSVEELTALGRLGGIRRLYIPARLVPRVDLLLAAFPDLSRLAVEPEGDEPTDLAPLVALPRLSRIETSGRVRNADLLPHVRISQPRRPSPSPSPL
jgi:hypothetical protein